jgi:hypothetical protein
MRERASLAKKSYGSLQWTNGSMLWSLFSAIFDNFVRKNWRLAWASTLWSFLHNLQILIPVSDLKKIAVSFYAFVNITYTTAFLLMCPKTSDPDRDEPLTSYYWRERFATWAEQWSLVIKPFYLYFCGQCLYIFHLSTHKQCIFSHFIHTSTAMFSLKNLIPWRDSNPGLRIPEAGATSTAPRRQGKFEPFLSSFGFFSGEGWGTTAARVLSIYERFF